MDIEGLILRKRVGKRGIIATYLQFIVENIYLRARHRGKVMQLQQGIYGLKDAVKIRNKLLFFSLEKLRLNEMKNAPCLFMKKDIVVLCYVEDLLLFAEQEGMINKIKKELKIRFRIKYFEQLKRINGLEVTWHSVGLLLM